MNEIIINVDKPGAKIDPLLYGIFFEELDFAGDGGIYAELIRNSSFEKTESTSHWSLIESNAKASMNLDSANFQLNKFQKKCICLTLNNVKPRGRGAIANEGYWGININKDSVYTLSFFARASSDFKGNITASLEDSLGKKTFSEIQISGVSTSWKKYTVKLKSKETDHNARLVLSANKEGKIWFDVISLFPPTFKNRPNGFRRDLIQKLIDLKPAFMRFPGGCYVQGYNNIDQAFNWKKSIGPLEEREGMDIMWGYYATVGMGYHEMLQLSEDIGAEPIYIANVGQTMKESVPDKDLQFWIDMAIDAIEYANGPVTSKWGALRAKNGHVKPFGMKTIGIGNEDAVPQFQEIYNKHYEIFCAAIKAKYPQMKFIQSVNHLSDNPKWNELAADYVDHHYYRSPAWFYTHDDKFDNYPRNEPKVFISELASLSDDIGHGNLWGALGEAAFMTSLERNADIIGMTCYAPLFRNIQWNNWNPNMILFNNYQSFGIPSYYLWYMFMHNTGDTYIPSKITNNQDTILHPSLEGKIGLGSWRTKVEYANLKVNWDNDSLSENFTKGIQDWTPIKGNWKIQNGFYQQLTLEDNCSSMFKNINSENYTFTLRARKIEGEEGFMIIFGNHGSDKFTWNIGGWNNSRSSLMCNNSFLSGEVGTPVPTKIEVGKWYSLKISVEGNSHIRCWVDNKLQQDYIIQPTTMKKLFVSVNKISATNELIIKVVNTTDKIIDEQLIVNGVNAMSNHAVITTLTSGSKSDENSFEYPRKVVPTIKEINIFSSAFQYSFEPYSVTFIRAKIKD